MTTHSLLLVDDSDDHRFITVTELRRIKATPAFAIIEASSGAQALEALDQLVKPDASVLLLADYRMPRMTGLELARAVRAKYGPNALRLVIYSSTDQGIAEESLQVGADEFMVKPMELQQFRTALRRLIADWYADKRVQPAKPVRRGF